VRFFAAVEKSGLALDVASNNCNVEKEIVPASLLKAAMVCQANALQDVDKHEMWRDQEFVLHMVEMQCNAQVRG